MKSKENKQPSLIFRWEMWGILFVVLAGSLLHFTFDFSGGWKPLCIISAVNESVWEHLKLAFWPAFIWTVIEYFFTRKAYKESHVGLIFPEAVGAYVMPLVIVVVFYSYTAFTGHSILAVDLSTFVVAVVIGQIVS